MAGPHARTGTHRGRRPAPQGLQRIQRAEHAAPALVEHMRVNHGGADIGMAQQLLHRADNLSSSGRAYGTPLK